MKESYRYCVCEEKINEKWSGCFSIRASIDCNPERFRIIKRFNTYEEARNFIEFLYD